MGKNTNFNKGEFYSRSVGFSLNPKNVNIADDLPNVGFSLTPKLSLLLKRIYIF